MKDAFNWEMNARWRPSTIAFKCNKWKSLEKKLEKKRTTLAFRRASLSFSSAEKYFHKSEKKLEKKRATLAFRRASLRPFFFGLFRRPNKGQIVDQRLTLNESQRKTALTITTPRSSTRSFANDLAPRLSTRELTLTQGDACRTHEGRY